MKIIVELLGGLGNQLFCYAFAYAISKEKNAKLYIDTSLPDNGIGRKLEILNFKIKYDKRISYLHKKDALHKFFINKIIKKFSIGIKTKFFYEKHPTKYDSSVFKINNDTYFKGYWQSEKYFAKYRNEILELFQFSIPRNISLRKLEKSLLEDKNSIAIHVRRGDYINIGCNISMDYYIHAIDIMKNILKVPLNCYVFSDDIDYCKKYFKNIVNVKFFYPNYISENYTIDDLFLMSCCSHMIMANSSYSWWAAWLNKNPKKIIICPCLDIWSNDFYPNNWIQINLKNQEIKC